MGSRYFIWNKVMDFPMNFYFILVIAAYIYVIGPIITNADQERSWKVLSSHFIFIYNKKLKCTIDRNMLPVKLTKFPIQWMR